MPFLSRFVFAFAPARSDSQAGAFRQASTSSFRPPLAGRRDFLRAPQLFAKRAIDVVLAAAGLALLAPVLAVIAALVRLDSPGPALFLQRRGGASGEPFKIYKFRTMTVMEDGLDLVQAQVDDRRVTRIGRVLRRCNLDELPQMINVLKGDMSLVGPRPHALAQDLAFSREVALYARRFEMRPGVTGWAQANGLRGEIDAPEKLRARVDHDLYYVDHFSLLLDLRILLMTLFSKKAYQNAV